MSNKAEELGLAGLSVGSVSPGQQMEADRIQRMIEACMKGIIDYRDNPHCVSTSMLPERPTPPPAPVKGTGWAEIQKLQPPDGIRQCDAIADHFDRLDRKQK
jgi:hypothetical protein